MSTIATLRIPNAELIPVLLSSAEGMYEVEVDQVREMLDDKSKSVLVKKEVQEGFARVAAIQEVVMKLKHATIIPPPSHKHPTIIPLTSHEQVAVVDMIIDFSWDTENDIVTEPLWGLRACLPELTTDLVDELRAEMNASIDRLIMVTELKTIWKEEMR
jgi:hypothetical protein